MEYAQILAIFGQ